MSKSALIPVDFHGATLSLVNHNSKPYVAIKPICEALTLDWSAQRQRMLRNPVLHQGMVITTTPSNGGKQEMVCLPLSMLNGWLFGINVNRVKNPAIREKLLAYQFECYDVLNSYWNGKESSDEKIVRKELRTIRALFTVDMYSGEKSLSIVPDTQRLVDFKSEHGVTAFIHDLDASLYPVIVETIFQHYKDVDRAYGIRKRRNKDFVSVPCLGVANSERE